VTLKFDPAYNVNKRITAGAELLGMERMEFARGALLTMIRIWEEEESAANGEFTRQTRWSCIGCFWSTWRRLRRWRKS